MKQLTRVKKTRYYVDGGKIAAGAASALNMVNAATGNYNTGVGTALSAAGSIASAFPGVGTIVGGALSGIGALTNMAFGSEVNDAAVANYEDQADLMSNTKADISSINALSNQINNFDYMDNISTSDIGSDGWFSNTAKNTASDLNSTINEANAQARSNLQAGSITLNNSISKNRMASWYDRGGLLHNQTFTNGVSYINNGGTHEQNPYEGVPMGMDSEGVPNLVEEGEVIFNDYVYSNRLKVDKDMQKKYKLKKGSTYADAAEKLAKESEERPNDPISQRGLESFMGDLANSQEQLRRTKEGSSYAKGGKLGRKFENGSDLDLDFMLDPYTQSLYNDPLASSWNYKADVKQAATSAATTPNGNSSNSSHLRYAPALGSAIGAISNLFSSPDYSVADSIYNSTNNLTDFTYTPVTQKLSYTPLDMNYLTTNLKNSGTTTRQQLINQSQGNRAAATASLLAQGFSERQSMGNLAKTQQEYNEAQKEKVASFNRETDSINNAGYLQAANFNRQNEQTRISAAQQAALLREQIANQFGATRSQVLTNLFDNLGAIGQDLFNKGTANNRSDLLYSTSGYKYGTKKNGGYLTLRNTKRNGKL